MALDEEQKPEPQAESSPSEQTGESSGDNAAAQPQPISSQPFGWMSDTLEWGIRARPGKHGMTAGMKHGMTMRDVNLGSYGEIPESSL